MKFNLTDKQKNIARLIVQRLRDGIIAETFTVFPRGPNMLQLLPMPGGPGGTVVETLEIGGGTFDVLEASGLIVQRKDQYERQCTVTGLIFRAVDTNFADDEQVAPISTLAQPHPPEIAMSIDRFRTKFPDPKKVGFLIMRFTAAKPFEKIVTAIKETGEKHGLSIVRADENEFHADLWGNVRTHLHGCGFGIAVYERIESEEPNANVGLEVGYLMAMNKPVLLLKDKTVATIQADLAGKLYKPFDPHDAEGTIPGQLTKWLEDNGIIVPIRKPPVAD